MSNILRLCSYSVLSDCDERVSFDQRLICDVLIKRWHDQTSLCEMGSTLQFGDIIVFHRNLQSLVKITFQSFISSQSLWLTISTGVPDSLLVMTVISEFEHPHNRHR